MPGMRFLLAAVAGFGLMGVVSVHAARAAPPHDAGTFLARQIRHADYSIDLDDNCPGNPTPGLAAAADDAPEKLRPPSWQDACRQLTTTSLLQILSNVPPGGTVLIEGANFTADPGAKRIELGDRAFPVNLHIAYSRFADRLYMSGAHFASLNIENSDFAGPLNAEYLTTDQFVRLDNDHLTALADFNHLRTGSYFELSSVYGDTLFAADDSTISGNLLLQHKISFRKIVFDDSSFDRSIVFSTLQLSGGFNCRRCSLAGHLSMAAANSAVHNTIANTLNFSQSQIAGGISISESDFAGSLNFKNVNTSNIIIQNANVGLSILANYDSLSGVFLLNRVDLQALSLAGANIGKLLDISALSSNSWPAKGGNLDLTDATVSAFTDCSASWPEALELDGFHYTAIGTSSPILDTVNPASPCSRIGGAGKTSSDQGWLGLLAKNTETNGSFNPQPYTVLAGYFAAAGNKQYANDILFRSRWLQMSNAWATGHWYEAAGLTILYLVAGFGIGDHAFLHILATGVISVGIAFLVLRFSAQARAHGPLWRIGACVERLLPIVELDKEFANFFDEPDANPATPKLARWQHAFFAIYALWGWFVGLVLAAVLSGLTQA